MRAHFLIGLAVLAPMAMAETFQTEVTVGYLDVASEIDGFGASAQYFFQPVDTDGRPWAEAPFLQREGSVFATATWQQWDSDVDASTAQLGVDGYFANGSLYVGLALNHIRLEDSFSDASDTSLDLTVGYSPIAGLLFATSYNTEVDYEPNIEAKYVRMLNGSRAINIEASYEKVADLEFFGGSIDFDDLYSIGADLYLDPTLSLGIVIDNSFDGTTPVGLEENSYGVRVSKFFTPAFGARGAIQDYEGDVMWSLEAALRF